MASSRHNPQNAVLLRALSRAIMQIKVQRTAVRQRSRSCKSFCVAGPLVMMWGSLGYRGKTSVGINATPGDCQHVLLILLYGGAAEQRYHGLCILPPETKKLTHTTAVRTLVLGWLRGRIPPRFLACGVLALMFARDGSSSCDLQQYVRYLLILLLILLMLYC